MTEGYLIDVDYDGQQLRVHGRNKAARIALAGQDHENDVVVAVSDIERVDFRDANALVNGAVVVHTRDGRKYQLHFRRKQRDAFRELSSTLQTAVSA